MNDNLTLPPPQEENSRLAVWAGFIIGIVYLIFFGFSIYIVTQQGYFDWTDTLLLIITSFAWISSFIGIALVHRGRYIFGTALIYIVNILPPTITSIILRDFSLIASVYILLTSFFFYRWVFPQKTHSIPIWAGSIAIVISILADTLNLPFQLGTSGVENFSPYIIGIMGLAFLALLLWQVWYRNIRLKLLSAIFVVISIVVFFQTGVNLRVSRELSENAEREHLVFLHNSYNDYVDTQTVSSTALSLSYADRNDIKDLYLAGDRDALYALLSPIFETLKEENNIRHLYIENPDGTVYLRIHDKNRFGGGITYRYTAAAALEKQETVAGVDVGASRIGVRSVSPLWKDGEFIGMVEVGLDYDQTFIDDLAERTKADYNLWITHEAAQISGLAHQDEHEAPTEELSHYASSNENLIILPISPDIYNRVLETKVPEIEFISVDNKEYAVLVAPMLAYGDRVIGIIEIIQSRTETLEAINQSRRAVLIPAILLALIGLTVLGSAITYVILRPVQNLTAVAEEQIAGNLSARVGNLPPDELGKLGVTLNTLAKDLDTTLKNQESIIAERTQKLEDQATYLESSVEVSQRIASITDTTELIEEVVRLIKARFNLYYVGLFLVDRKNEWANLKAGTGEAGKIMLARKHKLKIGEGMIGWSIENAQARIALDVGEDATRFDNPALPETRSEGALPLRSRGRVLGALTIQSSKPSAFTPEIIATLQTMTDQIAIALDNAELFAKSEIALKAERKAYGQLSQEDWTTLLHQTNIPHYLSDAPNSVHSLEKTKNTPTQQSKTMLQNDGLTAILPIKIHGHILGGVKLSKEKEEGVWTKEELRLAETLAEQVSVSLESARLFDQSQRRAARERVIGEVSAKMRETLSIDKVLETATKELHKALGSAETKIWLDTEKKND